MAAKEWSSGLAPEARLLHWYLCLCRVAIPSHLLLPFPVTGSLALVFHPVPILTQPGNLCPRRVYTVGLSDSADCLSCVGSLPERGRSLLPCHAGPTHTVVSSSVHSPSLSAPELLEMGP